MATRAELEAMITREATAAGMNPADFIRMAEIESSFNPNAGAKTSSAKGLFQFIDSTAKNYGLKNVYDPVESTRAAIRLAKDNIKATGAKDGAEMYMSHQWGAGGFNKMKNANPNASVESVLGEKAAKNNAMAGMTVAQGIEFWRNKFNGGKYKGSADKYTPTQTAQAQPELNTQYAQVALPDFSINSPSSIFGNQPNLQPMDAGQASYVNSRQQMLDTNFDNPQDFQSNQFEIATNYQNDTYQPTYQPTYQEQQNINISPIEQSAGNTEQIRQYLTDLWDNTDISKEEYMNG